MSVYAGPEISNNGLVLYLDAGNTKSYPGSGTVWSDLSGNGNNGTLTNGPTYSSANGGSIVFDGTNDQVIIPHNTVLGSISTGITISSWFKTSQTGDTYITTKNANSFYLGIGLSNPGKLSFYLEGVSNAWMGSNVSVNTGLWTYGAATWNGSLLVVYVNGILDNSLARGGAISTSGTNNIEIGSRDNVKNFNGNISNLKFYNRALSAAEISQNFNALRGRFGI